MCKIRKFILILTLFFVISCSASYEKINKNSFNPPDELSKYLYNAYKQKAKFEAEKMHDWNSAKLYSEKALDAIDGIKILPQKISYWKILPHKRLDLIKGYNNLIKVYDDSISLDPFNLSQAISSLDCWSEQQEENWQTLDIEKCRDDYLKAMHSIYKKLDANKNFLKIKDNRNNDGSNNLLIENSNIDILQIIYFDFNKYNLSTVSKNEIEKFISKNKEIIKKYIIIGHTDTVGSKEYNLQLSINRANQVKKILLELGIKSQNIKILGKGESQLSLKTEDDTPHPANRRAEISPLN